MAKASAQKEDATKGTGVPAVDVIMEQMPDIDPETGTIKSSVSGIDFDSAGTGNIETGDSSDSGNSSVEASAAPESQASVPMTSDELQQELDKVNDLYKKSTTEGKRLYQETKELKSRLEQLDKFSPILDALMTDSDLLKTVQGYYDNKSAPVSPVSTSKSIGLSDDFIFDPNEATTNPHSDSAKWLSAMIEKKAQNLLDAGLAKQSQAFNTELTRRDQEVALDRAKSDFLSKHPNLKMSDVDDLVNKAKSHQYTLDDIYFIINKDDIIKNAGSTAQSANDQRRIATTHPRSLSTVQSSNNTPATEADALLEIFGKQAKV